VVANLARSSEVASALLTWTVALLVPVAVLGALTAPLLMRALLGDDPTCAAAVEVGSRMLVVFMPQVVLYGVGIVLAGILQAHRRFLGRPSPRCCPAWSSSAATSPTPPPAASSRPGPQPRQELVLSVGTTLGVAVLSLGLVVPLRGSDCACGPPSPSRPASRRAGGGWPPAASPGSPRSRWRWSSRCGWPPTGGGLGHRVHRRDRAVPAAVGGARGAPSPRAPTRR
jgi:putative peptidoglycan lipid II flippase